ASLIIRVDIMIPSTFFPEACAEPQQSLVRTEVLTRQLRVCRAEHPVTCVESASVGTPATGAERAAVSPGERSECIELPSRGKRSEQTLRRWLRVSRAEIWWREPQRAIL